MISKTQISITMNDLNSLCLTCLSSVEDGASISESLSDFLQNELHFKCHMEETSPQLVCRKCYRCLIELRRFCTQLRDVELYFQCKSNTLQGNLDHDLIAEVHDAYTAEIDSRVPVPDQMKLDPILIDEVPILMNHQEVETKKANPRNTHKKALEKKYACGICSKLLTSIHELRSHESSHSIKSNPKKDILPVRYPLRPDSPKQKNLICPDCSKHFDIMKDLIAHKKKHVLDKRKPFRCFKCNRRFLTNEALRDHELVHVEVQMCQCEICHKRYLNQSSLEAHMRVSHNS